MATKEAEVTLVEFRARVVGIAELLETARSTVNEATAEAESLLKLTDGRESPSEDFPRFNYEISKCLQGLVQDLGGDDGGDDGGQRMSGEFDLDRMPTDARNLVDLIDLASTPRVEVAA